MKGRHSCVVVVAVVVLLPVLFVAVNLALAFGGPSSDVSRWRSTEAQGRFERAYAETMAYLPEPVRTWDVPTDWGTVRAYRFERPGADAAYARQTPLVLLPGYSAPVPMWRDTIPGLIAGRPVIALDLLGQPGLSRPTRKVENNDQQAAWLEQALAGMELPRVHLLGVSFGGWTAMNYARLYPQRVASVTLLDPAYTFGPPKVELLVATMLTTFPLMPKAYDEWFMSWTAGGAPADPTVPEAKIIGAGMEEFSIAGPAPEPLTDEQLRSIEPPVRAVMAGRSVVNDPEASVERGRALMPRLEISIKPEASHAIHGEYADEMNAIALDFAASHE